mgnify:CR=1 FL=1
MAFSPRNRGWRDRWGGLAWLRLKRAEDRHEADPRTKGLRAELKEVVQQVHARAYWA